MNKLERILVYPFDYNFLPLLRHSDLLNDYEITGIVSPKAWGMEGKDAGEAYCGDPLGMIVFSEMDSLFDKCETVMFVNPGTPVDFKKLIYPKMIKAIEAGKNILCNFRHLEEPLVNELINLSAVRSVRFEYNLRIPGEEIILETSESESILDINTPVVFVMGFAERSDKFETQLMLRKGFLKQGYRVSQVGSRDFCEITGFHSFPGFIYTNKLSDTAKVILFNNFIRNIEKREQPDVIIIGVPGGIMPFNNQFPNGFGITAYLVSQAVRPDAAVVNCQFDNYNEQYFQELKQSLKYKFGTNVCCFAVPNILFDFNASKELGKKKFLYVNSFHVNEKINELEDMEVPVLSLSTGGVVELMTNCVINHLAKYAEIESF